MGALLSSASGFAYSNGRPIEASIDWITGTLLGTVALSLCILAVAVVGLMMLAGQMPVKHGLRVVLGCFILLGAPVIASAFLQAAPSGMAVSAVSPIPMEADPRADIPAADYDPYAGASLPEE